ncbi:hypothetical protein [Nonomuraea sp. NPDC049400]
MSAWPRGASSGVHAQRRVAPEAVDLDAVHAALRALLPAGLGQALTDR